MPFELMARNLLGRALLLTLSGLFLSACLPAKSQSCLPNDPNGSNPGTLCFTFPSTLFPTFTMQNGYARKGFYGRAVSPMKPGIEIIQTPLSNEFFTRVSAQEGLGVTIETSSGRQWTIQQRVEN